MKLLRKKDVAKLFGVDLATIDRWHHEGALPVTRIKIRGLVFYNEEDVLVALEKLGLPVIRCAA